MNTIRATVRGDASDLFEQAKTLFSQGQLQASEAAFRELSVLPGFAADGFYGLGMLRVRRRNLDEAWTYFTNALRLNPRHANAHFQLGLIAEQRGAATQALDHFRRAAALNPTHVGAQQKLANRAALADALPPHEPDFEPQKVGVYQFALRDQTTSANQALKLIGQVQRDDVRPTLTSSLGVFLFFGLVSLVPLFLLTQRLNDTEFLIIASTAVLPLAVVFYQFLSVMTTRITIAKGRLQIKKGLLLRRLTNVELWRVRDVELQRGPMNQLTRDGTLILTIPNETPVRVQGVARGRDLDTLYQDLLNLVFVLRSNAVVKGIIS